MSNSFYTVISLQTHTRRVVIWIFFGVTLFVAPSDAQWIFDGFLDFRKNKKNDTPWEGRGGRDYCIFFSKFVNWFKTVETLQKKLAFFFGRVGRHMTVPARLQTTENIMDYFYFWFFSFFT